MILNYYWSDEQDSTKYYMVADEFENEQLKILVTIEKNGTTTVTVPDINTMYIDPYDTSRWKNFLERDVIKISRDYWFQVINFKAQLPNKKIFWINNLNNGEIPLAYIYKKDGTVTFNTFSSIADGCISLNDARKKLKQ